MGQKHAARTLKNLRVDPDICDNAIIIAANTTKKMKYIRVLGPQMDLEPHFLLKDPYLMKFLDQDHADRDQKKERGLIYLTITIGAGATKKMKQISII